MPYSAVFNDCLPSAVSHALNFWCMSQITDCMYLVDVFLSFMLLLRAFSKSNLLVMKLESIWDKSKIGKLLKADEASDMMSFQITVKPIKFEALKFDEKNSNQES